MTVDPESPSRASLLELLREEQALTPSNRRSLAHLAVVACGFAVALGLVLATPWTLPLAALLFGVGQYHLIVAHHEATHGGLFHPLWLNDLVGGGLAKLLSFDFEATRRSHLDHHRRLGFPDDPDRHEYVFEARYERFSTFLVHEILLGPLRGAARRLSGSAKGNAMPATAAGRLRHAVLLAATQGLLLLVFAAATSWWHYFALWLLPLMAIAGPLTRFRTFCEHAGLVPAEPTRRDQPLYARSHVAREGCDPRGLATRLEHWILGPFFFHLHHEHHMLPQVPYVHLPRLHRILVEGGYYERHPQTLGRSYARTAMALVRENRMRVAPETLAR